MLRAPSGAYVCTNRPDHRTPASRPSSDFELANDLAHVVGGTHSANFPVANAVQPRLGGGGFDSCGIGSCPRNAFVTRLNALGIVEYSTFLGGAQDAVANAIAIDDLNSVYVTGSTGGSFPTTPGSFQPNFGGGSADAFAARIDENAALGWATYLGGTDIDVGLGIAVDRERRSHVVGSTSSKDFPGLPFFQCCTYSFVLTLRAGGSAVDWSFQPDTVSPGGGRGRRARSDSYRRHRRQVRHRHHRPMRP
jgi:hypothetical protein